jgi:hypothetical protein
MNDAALAAFREGRVAEACRTLTRALELEPPNATLKGNLVRCLALEGRQALDRGEVEKARSLFEQGLAVVPDEPGLRLTLARLYAERDDVDRALAHLRALQAQEPGHPEAQRLLSKLEREREVEAGYWRDESRHFTIKYRGPRELEIRRVVLNGLEEAYDRLGRELDVAVEEKIGVILYPETVFREVTQVHAWAQAIFDGRIRIPVGDLPGRTRGLDRLLAHELAHALIHQLSKGRAPLWLHEGLAQQFEGGGDEARLSALRRIAQGEPPALDAIDSLIRSPEEERAHRGYVLAWSGVRYLLERRGMGGVREVLRRLGRGESWDAAFQAVYGQPFREFTQEWAARLARG